MKSHALIPVLLGAAFFAAPVTAAMAGEPFHDQPSGAVVAWQNEQCNSLQKQLDSAIKANMGAAKVNQARAMRAAGEKLCAEGNHKGGIAKLESALNDLGVNPQT